MDHSITLPRRQMLLTAVTATASLFFPLHSSFAGGEEKEDDVQANEDLMREHGIIRRILLVYQGASRRLRCDPQSVPLNNLLEAAKLFREFAEDYHERHLEETYIFPTMYKLGGKLSDLTKTLLKQHSRGREITDYILHCTAQAKFKEKDGDTLAHVLEGFVWMYEHHTAREDTVLFPFWKEEIGSKNYAEMGEKFEEIEHQIFGHDGFEEAVKRISKIEEAFGLGDLNSVTPPPPPKIYTSHAPYTHV